MRGWVAIALDRFPGPETGNDSGMTVLERFGQDPDGCVRGEALAALQRLQSVHPGTS